MPIVVCLDRVAYVGVGVVRADAWDCRIPGRSANMCTGGWKGYDAVPAVIDIFDEKAHSW